MLCSWLITCGLLWKIDIECQHYRGANTYVADKEGKTPVKLAAESGCGDDEILALLTSR